VWREAFVDLFSSLAPTKKFHQDTLSALNFANRAKTIEVKNDPPPIHQAPAMPNTKLGPVSGAPVRAFGLTKSNSTHNRPLSGDAPAKDQYKKSLAKEMQKQSKPVQRVVLTAKPNNGVKKPSRPSDPTKIRRGKELNIEDIVEKKVEEILAARALNEARPEKAQSAKDNSEEVNKRLEMLEKKLEKKADARAEGLTYILLAKQHVQRGEDFAALSMYRLALNYFPDNEKLLRKIADLEQRRKVGARRSSPELDGRVDDEPEAQPKPKAKKAFAVFMDDEPLRPAKRARSMSTGSYTLEQSPRTRQLLHIINSEDVDQIMGLKVCGMYLVTYIWWTAD